MRSLLTIVTRTMGGAFQAVALGRSKAQEAEGDTSLSDSPAADPGDHPAPQHGPQPCREAQEALYRWAGGPPSDVPTIGVL